MIRTLPTGHAHVKRHCKKCRDWKPLKGGKMGKQGKGFVCCACVAKEGA